MSPEPTTTFRQVSLPALGAAGGARAEAVALETERARAAGYAAGWAAGARAAAESAERQQRAVAEAAAADRARQETLVADGVAALGRAVRAAQARSAPVVETASREVLDAAVALAAAVVGHELADDASSARSVLARVADLPADLGVTTVRVSPADDAAIRGLLTGTDVTLPAGVDLVVDPGLARGDVVAEHPDGFVDGRVRSALERARLALEDAS